MNTQGLLYTLIPLAALAIGAIVTTIARPKRAVQSGIQHFAAGVVFAAAAAEILPDVIHGGLLVPTVIGSLAGIAVMLAIKALDKRIEGPMGLATATGVDLLVDGLVLGISFVAGARQGILLTIALTLEVLFLGLSLVGEFAGSMTRGKAIGATMLVGLALPLGAVFGGPIGTLSSPLQTGFYAFGLMALLYLVTEELLVEAHECGEESPLVASMFFLGFLAILVLDELMR